MNFSKFNIIIPPQDIQENPECLQRIASGDRKEFEWLYKNYCSKLYDYVVLLTADKFLSEDIVQEAFIKIWNNKEMLASVKNFNSYLYAIAKNLLLDKWRKKQLEKEHIKKFVTEQQPSEHNLFYQRNQEQTINAAIKKLSSKQQLVYKMIREEGMKREEVSKELNITPNTVKVTMQNALHNLKKQLSQ
jgi:RNA polymerase sigma-70 factor (family 1)